MPTYDIRCPACNAKGTIFRHVESRDSELPLCASCGTPTQRIISAPMVVASFPEYISPASGRLISSPNQRRDDLRRTGHIEWEPGIREAIEQRRQDLIEADYKKVDKTVDEIVTALNVSGRLDNE